MSKEFSWDFKESSIILKIDGLPIGKIGCDEVIEELWKEAVKHNKKISDVNNWKLGVLRHSNEKIFNEFKKNNVFFDDDDIPILTDIVFDDDDDIPILTDIVN